MSPKTTLSTPFLLAGPIVRKCTAKQVAIWLATSKPLQGQCRWWNSQTGETMTLDLTTVTQYQVGTHAWVVLIELNGDFATGFYHYQISTQYGDLVELYPELKLGDESALTVHLSGEANYVMHGSCRNPGDPCKDALAAAARKVAHQSIAERPHLLMMSGDQIYADHVAGPLLAAIHRVIDTLGLYQEEFTQAPVSNSAELYASAHCYYGRQALLPHFDTSQTPLRRSFLYRTLFGQKKEVAVFTSTDADNHLISFAEFVAMYLLVWSPTLWQEWQLLDAVKDCPTEQNAQRARWETEWQHIHDFVEGLHPVQAMLAHLPTYMMFDDHDVTDDWNLTVGWEYAATTQPFARRIIGNALLTYWLFQGWGNEPNRFDAGFHQHMAHFCSSPTTEHHNRLIDSLYQFEQWHYTTETTPKMIVLDTRTQRWRSESNMNKPSGLMDWEALMEFQQAILNQDKVLIVSPAPIFGVKFIEALQRVMTWLGKPLMVDAENWMAHPGSANTLLSIFTHSRTPTNFVILSGDVHYSFAYDIQLRSRKSSPNIFQITCSGFKNQFPEPLLTWCDYADGLLYGPRSPLNWFTKRKRLKIRKRHPQGKHLRHLVNHAAIGELTLHPDGTPNMVAILTSEGKEVMFPATKAAHPSESS
ncbi:alkaline phosphatase D family protein [Vibrio porteresiae]|uniref:Alkaline phosphatase D family protein n=1 Tax=Vibrio porteresiae DSM 19223 TaxID=1123496 RepID=A0ABZ0Q9C5_9VIBR|nr:alkaline phosphatase D family protein [Vibrio porteresiae]WPC72606.1 alkaline phosphatase D family protein [Vibrio porteresiae DSM 19223]